MVPSSDCLVPPFLEYHPLERKDSITKSVVISPDVCDFAVEREESDTTLQLGYSFFFLSSQVMFDLLQICLSIIYFGMLK